MPYACDKKGVLIPPALDKRRRITLEDREHIKRLFKQGQGIRQIARLYNGKCSRRLIQFILFPERMKPTGMKFYDRKSHAEYMKKHRRYKHTLSKLGKLWTTKHLKTK